MRLEGESSSAESLSLSLLGQALPRSRAHQRGTVGDVLVIAAAGSGSARVFHFPRHTDTRPIAESTFNLEHENRFLPRANHFCQPEYVSSDHITQTPSTTFKQLRFTTESIAAAILECDSILEKYTHREKKRCNVSVKPLIDSLRCGSPRS